MTSKIDKSIPIPLRKYPWRQMVKGESFLVKTPAERVNGLRVARAMDIKATSRKVKGGFRLWRTA